jgi:hypothetical protein
MTHSENTIAVVRRMKREGASNAEIAMAIGLTERAIKALCHKRGIIRPLVGALPMPIGGHLYDFYHAEAARRNMKLPRFMRKLLLRIAEDKLITAILDDAK